MLCARDLLKERIKFPLRDSLEFGTRSHSSQCSHRSFVHVRHWTFSGSYSRIRAIVDPYGF